MIVSIEKPKSFPGNGYITVSHAPGQNYRTPRTGVDDKEMVFFRNEGDMYKTIFLIELATQKRLDYKGESVSGRLLFSDE